MSSNDPTATAGWLNDSTRRTVRGVVQLLLACIPALPTLALLTNGNPPLEAALATLIVWGAAVTKLMNVLEDNIAWWPAWLKAPASPGLAPAPDPAA